MSHILNEVLAANEQYAAKCGNKAKLPMPPARHFAILTCMDARLDPAKYAGLAEGDAHVIRNAGGRATDDAIRSLVISYKLLGTREWFVVHHTDCGMETFSDEIMRRLLANSLEPATFDGKNWSDPGTGHGSSEGQYIDWLTISDQTLRFTASSTTCGAGSCRRCRKPRPSARLRRGHGCEPRSYQSGPDQKCPGIGPGKGAV